MPGLSQLKKFNADILSLGDEPGLRAGRGEKPVVLPIPKGIEDKDDSDDFITGMPEPVDYDVKPEKTAVVEEDFSDIMGTGPKPAAPKDEAVQNEGFSVPDLSSLADLGAFADGDGSGGDGAPDLSMFDEPIQETEPEPEPEPEEPEISDLGLEALLGGMGFDGSEGAEEEKEEAAPEEILEVPEDTESAEEVSVDDIINNAIKAGNNSSFAEEKELREPEDLSAVEELAEGLPSDQTESLSELEDIEAAQPIDDLEDLSGETGITDEPADISDLSQSEDLEIPDLSADDLSLPEEDSPLTASESSAEDKKDSFNASDFNDISFEEIEDLPQTEKSSQKTSPVSDSKIFDIDSIVLTETDKNPPEEKEEYAEEEPSFTSDDFGDIEIEDFNPESEDNIEKSDENQEADVSGEKDSLSDLTNDFDLEEPEDEEKSETIDTDFDFADALEDEGEFTDSVKKSPEAEETDLEFETDQPSIDMGESLPEEISEVPSKPVEDSIQEADSGESLSNDDFNLDENPFGDISTEDFSLPEESSAETETEDNFGDIPGGLFDSADMELPEMEGDFSFDPANDNADSESQSEPELSLDDNQAIDSMTQEGGSEADQADFGDVNLNSDESLDSFGDIDFNMDDIPSESAEAPVAEADLPSESQNESSADSLESPADDSSEISLDNPFGDLSMDEPSEQTDNLGLGDDFPDTFDLNDGDSSNSEPAAEEAAPAETFDISAMEGLDFGIPDTDSQIKGDTGFELGSSDDFSMDNGDFEIPGFSDVDEVAVNKNGKIQVPEAEKTEEEESESSDLPPYTLSDAQYEKYLKNLATYPLNVRMAVEELIVKNEFTDEAEFEIVTKVLKKVSARQLASELEKMLDISIPVPRDFERRTAEEYEAYKQSFQYQLKNKIIPGAVLTIAAVVVCFFLFEFTKNFIYKPARASILYKQGYTLLTNEDFPQSETKFNEATKYDLQKKWFFNYARGYKEHKQYIRAEQMYKNILYCFKHDLQAGLEYANMELEDLANYEKAEEVLLRDVLDYHVNDMKGLLLLGDNYLEWASEKDSSKFDSARKCYSELIQLYGSNQKYMDLFSSRMMRYFIRTDNLLEVLTLKARFFPRAKSISGQDWTDMSGYLLEKLYGPLPPSEEYLRGKIEDIKELLVRAVKTNPDSPIAKYNISKYYIQMNNSMSAQNSLNQAINDFEKKTVLKKKEIYKFIDSYRLLGEEYVKEKEYIKAMESFSNGISLFTRENVGSGLSGIEDVGHLYSDYGDLQYFVAGDMDGALQNYQDAVSNEYDLGEIRYKIGYIQYDKQNYKDAIGSFMKASEDFANDPSLLLAMGNSLSLRNDNYAAQSYYQRLLSQLNDVKTEKGILFPQVRKDEAEIVENFLKTTNNLGVTLYKIARRTGNSRMNAEAIVSLQDSLRAWDSMTRNQESMVRLGGSNLAEQNINYITHPMAGYEPAIYTDIPKTLTVEEELIR